MMQIGKPLRTIIVEPLELPVEQPTREPEPEPIQSPEPEPQQVPVTCREHPRLHLAHCRLPCLEVGKHGVEVALRRTMASRPLAGSEMQGFCCRRTHRWACGGCA